MRYLLPGRSLLRSAKETHPHSYSTFVASVYVRSRRLLVVCVVDEGSRGRGGLNTCVKFECCVGWSGWSYLRGGSRTWTRVPKRESGEVLLVHCVGGGMLSSVMRGSKAPGSKYLPRRRGPRRRGLGRSMWPHAGGLGKPMRSERGGKPPRSPPTPRKMRIVPVCASFVPGDEGQTWHNPEQLVFSPSSNLGLAHLEIDSGLGNRLFLRATRDWDGGGLWVCDHQKSRTHAAE